MGKNLGIPLKEAMVVIGAVLFLIPCVSCRQDIRSTPSMIAYPGMGAMGAMGAPSCPGSHGCFGSHVLRCLRREWFKAKTANCGPSTACDNGIRLIGQLKLWMFVP